METNFNGMYYMHANPIGGNSEMPAMGPSQYTTPPMQLSNAERLMNGLMALGNYASACMNVGETATSAPSNQPKQDEDILSEMARLEKHPALLTFDELKEKSKFAITVNDSGRLMVDGSLFNGVIKTKLQDKEEEKFVEYKLGNPVTIIHKSKSGSMDDGKTALKLTKFEYCKMTPYVTKTEKSLIYESKWDNPENETYLAVPLSVQKEAGITQSDNMIKSIS